MKTGHFAFRSTTQQLAASESPGLMARAETQWAAMNAAIAAGPYKPTWESLDEHACPEWFDDAKFGMFIDWGLYSVAGWGRQDFGGRKDGPFYPDWYLREMYANDQTVAYHTAHWGAEFQRDDFIPLFTAQRYDPGAIVSAARKAGMKYVVPFCKHHDGYCLWHSAWTLRNCVDMPPGRDLLSPLAAATRQAGLKFGAYFSVDEWEYPLLGPSGQVELERQWGAPGSDAPKLVPFDAARLAGRLAGKVPVRDFVRHYLVPQCKELIDLCDPDLLWFDGEWQWQTELRGTRELAAYYYNHAVGRKEVAVNDRYGFYPETRGQHGDFFTSEFNVASNQSRTHTWEECRSIGRYYGHYRDAAESDVLTAEQLVHTLADIVSRNGNLLLVVNPDASGAIPAMELERLEAVGRWLELNGEAIYGTRPLPGGKGEGVRMTQSKDGRFAYAILTVWPGRQALAPAVKAKPGSDVTMLGAAGAIPWRQSDAGVVVELGDELAKSVAGRPAWSLRVQTK